MNRIFLQKKNCDDNIGKASKKSDDYHFWGGGGQRGSFITFFFWSKNDF